MKVLAAATAAVGCSSPEESTPEPSSNPGLPRREAPAPAPADAPAAAKGPDGPQSVSTFAPPPAPQQCGSDGDCRTFSDTCGGCTCRPLGAKESAPKCAGEEAACFGDPCGGKIAACDLGSHVCVVK